jgi:hypothetical protein
MEFTEYQAWTIQSGVGSLSPSSATRDVRHLYTSLAPSTPWRMGRLTLSNKKKSWAKAVSKEQKVQAVIKAKEKERLWPRKQRVTVEKLAKDAGINRRLVFKRLQGVPSKIDSAANRKVLFDEEEDMLAAMVKSSGRRADPVDGAELLEQAQAIVDARLGKGVRILGKSWLPDFLARRTDLHTYWSSRIDDKRAYALNTTNLRDYFDHLKERYAVCKFEPQNIYGYDESCIMLGQGSSRKRVIGAKGKKRQALADNDSRDSFTLAVCISANGSALDVPPWMIFEGKSFPGEWAEQNSLDAT